MLPIVSIKFPEFREALKVIGDVPIKPNITPISWPTEGGGMYGFLGCWLDILTTLNEQMPS